MELRDEDVVERAFGAVREEVAGGVTDAGFQGKLRGARMKGRPWGVMAGVVSVLVVGLVGVPMWWGHGRGGGQPVGVTVAVPDGEGVAVGEVVITERVAYQVDARRVVVAWEVSGGGAGVGELGKGVHHHRYTEVPLRRVRTGTGEFCVSVFVADGDVAPMLVPPTIVAETPGGGMVGFAVSPMGLRGSDVAEAMKSAMPAGVKGVTMGEVEGAAL